MGTPKPRILVVDDEPRAVELLVRSLRKQGKVDTAGSGDEAWAKFQAESYALVISDQRMPGMSGVDLLGLIAGQDETVGRILLTGYSDLEATVEAINRGRVHAYLHKPCSPQDLGATVKGVLDRVSLARDNVRLLGEVRERNGELEEAMASLAEAQDRAVTSERLAAIGRMGAVVVHDLRSPLTVLNGIGGEIRHAADAREDKDLADLADELRTEVEHMQRMCEELLEVTRATERVRELASESLDDVVDMAVSALGETAAGRGVALDTATDSGARVNLHEDGIRRALRNLVNNAIEASSQGGRVEVATSVEGAEALVRVSDQGGGIPDDMLDRLFEPFATSGKRGGTGLGLTIVKKVMDDHGGGVAVETAAGEGTCFTLRLPLSTPR